jgi:hypothetical protein
MAAREERGTNPLLAIKDNVMRTLGAGRGAGCGGQSKHSARERSTRIM